MTLDIVRFDRLTQLLDENHVTLTRESIPRPPIVTRFICPSERDLMARLAGLRRHAHRGGWNGAPFDTRSTRCISVYGQRRPGSGRPRPRRT